MTEHKVGTREQWLVARKELLEREKDLTRRSDELALERQELPWVPVGKEYAFETGEGTRTLGDLFAGRSQLLVYHFMFGPWSTAGQRQGALAARSPWTRSTATSSTWSTTT